MLPGCPCRASSRFTCASPLMAAATTVSASCRTISNADAKGPAGPLFVLVHWHEDSKLFDIWITDCKHAWSATGCSVAYQAMDAVAAWKRTKEALGDEAAASTQYAHSARTPARGPEQQLELTWSWQRNNSQVREMMRVMPLLQQQQQQDTSSTVRLIMTHIMASYTAMRAAMDELRKAQLLLERSLRDRQQQLQQKTEEWQGKEQALFTKFAMLLNKKSERIQSLTNTVQEQARQLDQLQGEEAHSTDDEALARVYGADTEDDEPDEQDQLQQGAHHEHQQPLLLKQEELPSEQAPRQPPPPAPEAAAGAAAKPGSDEAAAVDAMDLDQATQLLDDDAQAALELQRQQYLQRQQHMNGSPPGAAQARHEATAHVAAGVSAATGLEAPAPRVASSSDAARQQEQQQLQGGPAEDAQRKPKAFKRRR